MISKFVVGTFFLALCFGFATRLWADEDPSASHEDQPHSRVQKEDTPEEVEPVTLTGNIFKDKVQNTVEYDLSLGNDKLGYSVKGSMNTDKGFYRSDLDLSFFKVKKTHQDNRSGLTKSKSYENKGSLHVFPRWRSLEDAKLAGVSLGGHYIQGMFNDGLWFQNTLTVDGVPAQGALNYWFLDGKYYSEGGASFGDARIKSNGNEHGIVMNYNNFVYGENSMLVSMNFGGLKLNGRINFNDVKDTHTRTDSDGHTSTYQTLRSRKAQFNVKVVREDGSPVQFSKPNEAETQDDKDARKLLAFLQLVGYDAINR